jgi:hypothetical protein
MIKELYFDIFKNLYHINYTWPQAAVVWLKLSEGKLARFFTDSYSLYVLLWDISAAFVTATTLKFAVNNSSPV